MSVVCVGQNVTTTVASWSDSPRHVFFPIGSHVGGGLLFANQRVAALLQPRRIGDPQGNSASRNVIIDKSLYITH
jgi:hypothetical protein